MTGDKITYVPTLVRWVEDGKVQERRMKIEEGFSFNFERSKNYTAKAFNSKGKIPVMNLTKEEAYNILGLSHASETEAEKKNKEYVLDRNDLEAAKREDRSNIVDNLTHKQVSWAGYGARVVDMAVTTGGGLSIVHKGTNQYGKSEEYLISVFHDKK